MVFPCHRILLTACRRHTSVGCPMRLYTDTLNRATNRDPTHAAQLIESCHQALCPSDAQDNDGVFLQGGKPVATTIGDSASRPIAGSDATIEQAANGGFSRLNPWEVSFRSQSNHATAQRTSVPTDFQRMGKAGKTNRDKAMAPDRRVAATTRRWSRPTIIACRLCNFLEIQANRQYHKGHVLGAITAPEFWGG